MKKISFYTGFICFIVVAMSVQLKAQNTAGKFWNEEIKQIALPQSHPGWIYFNPDHPIGVNEVFDRYKNAIGLSADDEMVIYRTKRDHLGYSHYKYNQYYKGVWIEGTSFILHERNGIVQRANGQLIRDLNLSVKPSVKEEIARANAVVFLQKHLQEEGSSFKVKEDSDIWTATWSNIECSSELVIAKVNPLADNVNDYQLFYKWTIVDVNGRFTESVYVDAQTGEAVRSESHVHNCQNNSNATTCTQDDGNSQQIIMTFDSGQSDWRLYDDCRNVITKHEIFNQGGCTSPCINNIYLTGNGSGTTWTHCEKGGLHWMTEMTYDYLMDEHGRDSYDDAGAQMESRYWDDPYISGTAQWNNIYEYARFSQGQNLINLPGTWFATLDIVGHEYTHATILSEVGMGSNNNQTGALHESYCDMMGSMVEYYAEGLYQQSEPSDYLMAEDIYNPQFSVGFLRSLEQPHNSNFAQPNTYNGTYWGGSKYKKMGVPNHWFYLLAEGKAGTNNHGTSPYSYDVEGIGRTNAAKIVYRTIDVYNTAGPDFNDAREDMINSATDIFGACSYEVMQVAEAWNAVGVYGDGVLTLAPTSIDESCLGAFDGSISSNVSGGVGPYCYLWSNGQTGSTATGLSAGTYTVWVMDATGASGRAEVTILQGTSNWPKTSNPIQYEDRGNDIALDASRNSYVVGDFKQHTFFDGVPINAFSGTDADMFLASVDECGQVNWVSNSLSTVPFSGSSYVTGNSVTVHEGYIYVTGLLSQWGTTFQATNGQPVSLSDEGVYVVKYDLSGNILAGISTFPSLSSNAVTTSITTDNQGYIFMTGYDGNNAFIIKCDPNEFGNSNNFTMWTEFSSYPNPGNIAKDIVVDDNGYIYVTGQYATQIGWGGSNVTATGLDAFVVRFEDGLTPTFEWLVKSNANFNASGEGIAWYDDAVYVTGSFSNTLTSYFGTSNTLSSSNDNAFLASLDIDNGIANWIDKVHGMSQTYFYARGVDVDADSEGAYFTGYVQSHEICFVDEDGDLICNLGEQSIERFYVVKMTHAGNGSSATMLWMNASDSPSGPNFGQSKGIAVDPQYHFAYTTGIYMGDLMLPPGQNLTGSGPGTSTFLVRNGYPGNVPGEFFKDETIREEVIKHEELTIYPNPNNGEFMIRFGEETYQSLTIFDMLGKPLTSLPVMSHQMQIDLSDHPTGIYYLRFIDGDRVETRKVICR